MKFRLFSLCLITLFIFSGTRVFSASSSSILVDMVPSNPAPFENVSINLNSYANNLDSVLIKWSLDGKIVSSGIGKKTFLLTAPSAGSTSTVIATISLPEGEIETKITIRPNTMVLLWQANDSFVPPFYRGKAMPTADSEIKIVAMPEVRTSAGGTANPRGMTYAWKKDYTNDQEASGYGKNFFLYTNDYLEDSSTVSVVASTVDQNYSSEATVTVGTTTPKILFYKNDNTLGTFWQKTLPDTHRIQGPEIIVAVPYFISPKELQHPRLIWSWSINDSPVGVPIFRKDFMPVQAQPGVSGTSKLKLVIENMDRIFQTTSKEMNIEF